MWKFEVLGSELVTVSSQGIEWQQSMVGQLTWCRTAEGVEFYVREGLDGTQSFHIASNQRWGEKHGSISRQRQVLLLACEESWWEEVAALVQQADEMGRPVRRNRRFTLANARQQFKEDKPMKPYRVRYEVNGGWVYCIIPCSYLSQAVTEARWVALYGLSTNVQVVDTEDRICAYLKGWREEWPMIVGGRPQ